jgi:hypothetical protein
MKMDWNSYIGQTLNITMYENYGVVNTSESKDHPTFYEIVFKTGKLIQSFDEGLLLESNREERQYHIYVPYSSIKCIEIF